MYALFHFPFEYAEQANRSQPTSIIVSNHDHIYKRNDLRDQANTTAIQNTTILTIPTIPPLMPPPAAAPPVKTDSGDAAPPFEIGVGVPVAIAPAEPVGVSIAATTAVLPPTMTVEEVRDPPGDDGDGGGGEGIEPGTPLLAVAAAAGIDCVLDIMVRLLGGLPVVEPAGGVGCDDGGGAAAAALETVARLWNADITDDGADMIVEPPEHVEHGRATLATGG